MRVAFSGTSEHPSWVAPIFANKWTSHFIFAIGCAIAGYLCITVYAIGGLTLVSCVIVCLLFAVIALADLRAALLFTFAFSLFQPLLTRLLFHIDFPRAVPQGMLYYRDPLTTTTSLLLICCGCLALLPELTGKPSSVPRSLLYLIGFFAVINLLQVFNPNNTLLVGIYGLKNSVLPVLMILVGCLVIRTRDDLARFATFIAWFSMFALVYGIYQEVAGLPAADSFWYSRTVPPDSSMFLELDSTLEVRIPSVFQGYTTYSYVITAFGILIYALGRDFGKGAWKYLRVACLCLLGLYFALSMERTAIGMFVVGVLVFHLVISRNGKRMLRFLLVGGIVVLSLYGVFYKTSDVLREKGRAVGSTKLIRLAEMADPLKAQTVTSGRIRSHWARSVARMKAHPLTGMGSGSATHTRGQTKHDEWRLPHNEFFQKQIELGVFGSAAFIAMLYTVYRKLLERASDPDEHGKVRKYAAGMGGVLAAYVACAIFNVPFTHESGIVFWFLAGVAFHKDAGVESRA
jgi:hypothetical protein